MTPFGTFDALPVTKNATEIKSPEPIRFAPPGLLRGINITPNMSFLAPRLRAPLLSNLRSRAITTSAKKSALPAVQQQTFDVAKFGSNQASLEAPRNGVEYALSTMDKVVNWARQGSMWPMVRRWIHSQWWERTERRQPRAGLRGGFSRSSNYRRT